MRTNRADVGRRSNQADAGLRSNLADDGRRSNLADDPNQSGSPFQTGGRRGVFFLLMEDGSHFELEDHSGMLMLE